jgi:hypothetical protein
MHESDVSPGAENYEHRDAQLKLILYAGIALVVVTLISYLIGFVIMNSFESRKTPTDYVASPILNEQKTVWVEGQRLQVEPWTEFEALQHKFEQDATTAAVISEEPSVYRIPIAVAIDLVAKNGLPEINAIPAAETPAAAEEAAPARDSNQPANELQ